MRIRQFTNRSEVSTTSPSLPRPSPGSAGSSVISEPEPAETVSPGLRPLVPRQDKQAY
jgi:hypothetical protein